MKHIHAANVSEPKIEHFFSRFKEKSYNFHLNEKEMKKKVVNILCVVKNVDVN